MSMWISVKIFSDCCVIFGILAAFPKGFPYSGLLLIPALLCAAGAGLAAFLQEHGKGRLCWLGILLPLCSLLLAQGAQRWILLPVISYGALVILRQQFALEYYSFSASFRQSLTVVFGLYVILCMLSFLEGISESDVRTIYPDVTLRYGIVHLIVGVILQRQLRLGMENHEQGSRLQLAGMLGSTGAVIGIFLIAEPVLRKGASAVWNVVLSAVAGVAVLISNFFESLDFEAMQAQVKEHRANSDTPVMGTALQEMIQSARQEPETESQWWIVLLLILVAVVMVLMLRTFRKSGNPSVSQEIVEKIDIPAESRRESRRTNRGKIRHCYREYLRMEKKRGLRLRRDMTTADILERITADTNPTAASELRQLYLRARYDEKAEITREQAEAAKAALKRSRSISS